MLHELCAAGFHVDMSLSFDSGINPQPSTLNADVAYHDDAAQDSGFRPNFAAEPFEVGRRGSPASGDQPLPGVGGLDNIDHGSTEFVANRW